MSKVFKILFLVTLFIVLILQIILPSIQIGINIGEGEKDNVKALKNELILLEKKVIELTNNEINNKKERYSMSNKINELMNKQINDKKDLDWLKEYAFIKYETEYNDGDDFSDRELLMDGFKYVESYYKARKELINETGFYDIRNSENEEQVYLVKQITSTTSEEYLCDIRINQIGNRYFSTPRDRLFNDGIEKCRPYKNGKLTEKDLKKLEEKINKIFSKYSLYKFY